MNPYQRIEEDPATGEVVGYPWAGGPPVILRRMMGLTNEEPCSEAAHQQMFRWWKARHEWFVDSALEPVFVGVIRAALVPAVPMTSRLLLAVESTLAAMVAAVPLLTVLGPPPPIPPPPPPVP